MNTITHIAAQHIDVNGRIIQRCAWCGFKLVDTVKQPITPGTLQLTTVNLAMPNVFVKVDSDTGNVIGVAVPEVLPEAQRFQLPEDFCVNLVE